MKSRRSSLSMGRPARRSKLVALCLAAGFSLTSCGGSSYPKAKVAERLVAVCKSEYNLDVKAQVAGTTLGAQVEIPGLMDELRKFAPSTMPELPPVLVEGKYTPQALDFRMFSRGTFAKVEKKPAGDEGPREPSEPLKKLQQVSTALMRACLSTDAPLEFYKLVARDPGPDHLDILLSGHILDSKRAHMYAISISELQSRNEFSLRHQPEEVARAAVAGFVADLSRRPLPQLLSRYTAPSKRFGDLLPTVLAVAADLKGVKEENLKPEEWPARQVGKETVLVYLPLKPMGGKGAHLFSVQLQEEQGTLLAIEKLEDGSLPAQHRSLGPPKDWSNAFYLEAISLPEFVTEQIAKRVMSEFKSTEEPAAPPGNKPAVKPAPKGEPAAQPATIQDVTISLMGAAAYVTQNYNFKGFNEVSVVDALKGTHWVVPAAELPLYRRRNPPELKPIP